MFGHKNCICAAEPVIFQRQIVLLEVYVSVQQHFGHSDTKLKNAEINLVSENQLKYSSWKQVSGNLFPPLPEWNCADCNTYTFGKGVPWFLLNKHFPGSLQVLTMLTTGLQNNQNMFTF